jgi:GcrA cell cycle regulator
MSWTDDRVATLTKLWADGLSASQIAAELGGVTRNAVIGKVHRLGLSGRAKPASSSARKVKTAAARSSNSYNARPRALRPTGSTAPSVPSRPAIEDIPVPVSKKILLEQLTDKTCKWPDGDPSTDDFHFCGNNTKEETPYCEYHCRMAYQTVTDRRRVKRAANG